MTFTSPFSTAHSAPSLLPTDPPRVTVDLELEQTPSPDAPEPPEDPKRPRRFVVLATLGVIALGVVAFWWFTGRESETTPTSDDVAAAIDDAFSSTTVPAPIGPAIYNTIIPSVVFIQNGEADDDSSSIGSGVIINANGNIMTSHHVVDGATSIRVSFTDGTTSDATVVQADPSIDIAILRTNHLPEVVVPAVLGGGLRIGDDVFAVGNPLGLGGSFSAGVVSGLDRTLPLADGQELNQLIQFDAAVNPGSSGGPLLDRNAQVVGIVTALANPTGEDFFSGIGFAVPIATAGGAAGGPEQ